MSVTEVETEAAESPKRVDSTVVASAVIATIGSVAVAWITASFAGKEAGETAGARAGETRVGELAEIPSGAVLFFNLTNCPAGWQEKSNARGRYLVGLNPAHAASLDQTQGRELTNLENRAVGRHAHPDQSYMVGGVAQNDDDRIAWGQDAYAASRRVLQTLDGLPPTSTPSITNDVEGTSAPYLQLLICEKQG